MIEPTEEPSTPSPKHTRSSRGQSTRSAKQQTATPRPPHDDGASWKRYWVAQGQPWRKEPEIDEKRQRYLTERRAIPPDIEQGIYPFKDIKLSRADLEWLLAQVHEEEPALDPIGELYQFTRVRLDLRGADLRFENLHRLPLTKVAGGLLTEEWFQATSEQREAAAIHLEGADLSRIFFTGAWLRSAHLEGANLSYAHLEGTSLRSAHLEGKRFSRVELDAIRQHTPTAPDILPPATLRYAYFDRATALNDIHLGTEELGFVQLGDIRWGETNLSVVDWDKVSLLGDACEALHLQARSYPGKTAYQQARLLQYRVAVRANRQLANVLRTQGLNEAASSFAYRAENLQREVFRQEGWRKFGAYCFSWFLYLIAGYGYRPRRSIVAYLAIILAFMGLYLLNGHFVAPALSWDQALVLSVSSFHGRGFFEQDITLGSTYARLAAAEAMIGLLIEISFIATFTQRFFGR